MPEDKPDLKEFINKLGEEENSEEAQKQWADAKQQETIRLAALRKSLEDPNSELPDSTIDEEVKVLTKISDDLKSNPDVPRDKVGPRIASMAHRILEKEHEEHNPKRPYDPKKGEQSFFYIMLAQRGLVSYPPKVSPLDRIKTGIKSIIKR